MMLRIVLAAALPFVVAAACLTPAALRAGRRGPGGAPLRVPLAGALAVGGGYVIAAIVLLGWPPWPPVSADERLLWLVVAGALLGALAGTGGRGVASGNRPSRKPPLRDVLYVVALAALVAKGSAWLLRSAVLQMPAGQGLLASAAGVVTLAALVFGLGALSRRQPGALTPALLCATSVATAFVMVIGSTAKYGQLSGALASALAAAALVGLWRRDLVLAGGATAAYAIGHGGLLLSALAYTYHVTWHAAVPLALAPLAPALVELPALRSLRPRPRAALRAGLVLALLATALAAAWLARPEPYDY